MSTSDLPVETLADLRSFVAKTLSDHEQLEPGAFPLFERLLHRRGRPCGIHFCLAAPRSVRLTAIWEAEKRTVLFYDSTGERFQRVELSDALLKIPAKEYAA